MLVVGLTPAQAIGAGLLTEVFGMGNGLANYVRQGVVDYATAKWLLAGAVPAVVATRHWVSPARTRHRRGPQRATAPTPACIHRTRDT